eukprot:CAMPEP_0182862698 /NCGR_PEP_ID=MMETSP0034_2-20130328/6219_1 /TAXON_ID=156128 /ORGANISM="Nephroselmis pyriformis, Strain CCMP717" /LENGTH=176 /DNA_ID=CAMNT_0024994801 /DNA_START=12 /DNA_END=543 /DNA_ORIENTATION=+
MMSLARPAPLATRGAPVGRAATARPAGAVALPRACPVVASSSAKAPRPVKRAAEAAKVVQAASLATASNAVIAGVALAAEPEASPLDGILGLVTLIILPIMYGVYVKWSDKQRMEQNLTIRGAKGMRAPGRRPTAPSDDDDEDEDERRICTLAQSSPTEDVGRGQGEGGGVEGALL